MPLWLLAIPVVAAVGVAVAALASDDDKPSNDDAQRDAAVREAQRKAAEQEARRQREDIRRYTVKSLSDLVEAHQQTVSCTGFPIRFADLGRNLAAAQASFHDPIKCLRSFSPTLEEAAPLKQKREEIKSLRQEVADLRCLRAELDRYAADIQGAS
ncbi:hypothetical protein ACM64Y_10605 [Novispirillum sp. DQ9]|uniref:hypothetical protein n=1 Tax=Novispirillum sp. DQ9 TaxID=3398612 RepID=UPI003C7ACB29